MLYLNPPFHIIEGISLLPDHADPIQYYFMPLAPHLTLRKDAQSGQLIPQFQFIKYRGRAGNGGFLNFDVNLGVEQEVLENVRAQLKQAAKLPVTPRLAPLPLVDGSVKMLLFGARTGEVPTVGDTPSVDAPSAEGAAPKFVLKLDHHAKPALYGDNQAAFSVQLDQYGVSVLEKALQGEITPIGIIYSLDYWALRPAYSVRLNVDWERVQKHLEEQFGAQLFISSIEIDNVVDELVEKRAIVIEADTFVPEGEDESGIISRRDQALDEVRDMVTDAFFQPTLNPVKQEKDGWDKAAEFARRMGLAHITSGASEAFGFSYKKVDLKRIDKKSLNVNISERTTVKRSIYPQGHLTGLFRIFEQQRLDPKRFLLEADIDGKWFERRRLDVQTNANFQEDAIDSINVTLKYGNDTKSVRLDATAPKQSVDWASVIVDDVMQREVTYSYKVNFDDVDSSERPIVLTSLGLTTGSDTPDITPRNLYSITPIKLLVLSGFPWTRYSAVEVEVRYIDESNSIRLHESFLLTEKAAEQTWKRFLIDPQRKSFEYKLIYHASNHKDVTTPWIETDDEQLIIRDPYPAKRTLQIVPNFDWNEVERAFVDVSYEDPANQVSESAAFEFSAEHKDTVTFSVDLRNPDVRLITYEVTVLFKGGLTHQVPKSFTRTNRIIASKNLLGHRIVAVSPVAADFATKKAKILRVELRYEDAESGLNFHDTFDFTAETPNSLGFFEYDFAERPAYEYRTSVRFQNGLAKETSWKTSNVDELVIPIS